MRVLAADVYSAPSYVERRARSAVAYRYPARTSVTARRSGRIGLAAPACVGHGALPHRNRVVLHPGSVMGSEGFGGPSSMGARTHSADWKRRARRRRRRLARTRASTARKPAAHTIGAGPRSTISCRSDTTAASASMRDRVADRVWPVDHRRRLRKDCGPSRTPAHITSVRDRTSPVNPACGATSPRALRFRATPRATTASGCAGGHASQAAKVIARVGRNGARAKSKLQTIELQPGDAAVGDAIRGHRPVISEGSSWGTVDFGVAEPEGARREELLSCFSLTFARTVIHGTVSVP